MSCFAQLTFASKYLPLVDKEIEDDPECYYSDKEVYGGTAQYQDSESDAGEMPGFTDILDRLRIPYDLWRESDYQYDERLRYVRFDEAGEQHITEYLVAAVQTVVIDDVRAWLDAGLTTDEIRKALDEAEERYRPWNNQWDLDEIPLRELTPEESALVMAYKIKEE